MTAFDGLRLPFEITAYERRARRAWSVAGVPATDHTVAPLGPIGVGSASARRGSQRPTWRSAGWH